MPTARYVRKREKPKPTLIPDLVTVEPTAVFEKFLTDMDGNLPADFSREKLITEHKTGFQEISNAIRENLLIMQDAHANIALQVSKLHQLSQKIPKTEHALKEAIEKYQNFVDGFISDTPTNSIQFIRK